MSEHETRGAIDRLARRLMLAIGRGKIRRVDDTGAVQRVQLSDLSPGEVRDRTMRATEFGFASWPIDGADAVVLFVGGDRSNAIVIATNDQAHRFKLAAPGEAALFDAHGKSIWLKADGSIVVEANGGDVTIKNGAHVRVECSELYSTGPIKSEGDITDNVTGAGKSMADMRAKYDIHTHGGGTIGSGTTTGPTPTV